MLEHHGEDPREAAAVLLHQRAIAPAVPSDDFFDARSEAQLFQLTRNARGRARLPCTRTLCAHTRAAVAVL